MNFLAHAYLSGSNEEILVGNFIADFVKGKQALNNFTPGITKGIMLHRVIDQFTDVHDVVKESKRRLQPKYRHYAAVIVDVFYDHFLARKWTTYHRQPLTDFAQWVYDAMLRCPVDLPSGMKYMLPYMIRGNWLLNYSKIEGISRTLSGMAQRTSFESKMDEATADLESNYQIFADDFERFFPALQARCTLWMQQNT